MVKVNINENYNVEEKTQVKQMIIKISIFVLLLTILSPSQILAISSSDIGFNVVNMDFDYTILLRMAFSIACVFIAYSIWKKMAGDTIEFCPSDNLNSVDVAFLYNGYLKRDDVISLLICLANKGYLKIEEYEERILIFKSKNFKIIKLKEYDGNNETEREFFDGLFKSIKLREEVTKGNLYNSFYIIVCNIVEKYNRKENFKKIFKKNSLGKREFIFILAVIIFMLITDFSIFDFGSTVDNAILGIMGFCLIGSIFVLYDEPIVGRCVCSMFFVLFAGLFRRVLLIEFLTHSVCMVLLIIFSVKVRERTNYGKEMLEKIQGLKNFLKVVEKTRLQQLAVADPEYFYDVLPYAYALGISKKLMKKFEDIDLQAPRWYCSDTDFSIRSMNSMYRLIVATMTSIPD